MNVTRRQGLAFVTALVLLVGCSGAEPPEASGDEPLGGLDVSVASAAQSAEISDGVVTADEYQAAFQRYRECLSVAGYEMTYADLSGPVYDYAVPAPAVADDTEGECYDAEFRFVDILWQGSQPAGSDSETAEFYRNCLQKHGIEPSATVAEMDGQLRETGIEITECLG